MTVERELSLIVPVHHCAGSLATVLHALAGFSECVGASCELILVDDHGNDADAATMLAEFARRDDVLLLRNDRNRGKGFSVRRGMLEARGRYRVFTDADLAYPLDQVARLVDALRGGADVAIASRAHAIPPDELPLADQRYFATRQAMSRTFNMVVRATLLPGIVDSQAGLKAFTARAADAVFTRVQIPGFGFDLECLYVAKLLGLNVEQIPVEFRYGNETSTVRIAQDGFTMLGDLARIHWRAWMGHYGTSASIAGSTAPTG